MENDDDYRIFLEESKTKTVLLKGLVIVNNIYSKIYSQMVK